MSRHLLIPLTLLGMIMSAHGQGTSRLTTPSSAQTKQLEEATEKLRQAQANGQLDKAKAAATELAKKLPTSLTDAAKAALESPQNKANALNAVKSAAQTLLPQAQGLITPAPAAAPVQTQASTDQPPVGPQPQPLESLKASPSAARQAVAVIDADNSVFDQNTSIVIYTGHVRARHPQFYIECDELIVHLVKQEPKKEDSAPQPKKTDPVISETGPKKEQNPIKKAFASGSMVKIEKRNPNGELHRAFCRKSEYDGPTGNMKMWDNPQVQTGNVMQMATTPDTVMMFDQKGNFTSNRATRTVITQEDKGAESGSAGN